MVVHELRAEQEQGLPAMASAKKSTARTDKMLTNFMAERVRLRGVAACSAAMRRPPKILSLCLLALTMPAKYNVTIQGYQQGCVAAMHALSKGAPLVHPAVQGCPSFWALLGNVGPY